MYTSLSGTWILMCVFFLFELDYRENEQKLLNFCGQNSVALINFYVIFRAKIKKFSYKFQLFFCCC